MPVVAHGGEEFLLGMLPSGLATAQTGVSILE